MNGLLAIAALFSVFLWYHFFFAPQKGAAIAAAGGRDAEKWHAYIWAFGIFAVLYLYLTFDPLKAGEKRSLVALMSGYMLIFCAAVGVDRYVLKIF